MSESHQREAAIFDAAMELPPGRRSGYLDEACGEDAALRRRVESLLKAGESQCVFLDSPAGKVAGAGTAVLPVSEKPGETIGRYKLLEQIGEGGCGVVYVAEQAEPVRRRVALKIIKLGMDTRSVIARFEAERQALALMDHPNIAKVFDAGATEAGRPYFVMELVRGLKITEFCDEKKLGTRARLDLFIQVCQAIQHAHQKGIIHRDIKPSNILVTMNDGIAVPKVIDFGIAKATSGQQLTDKTIYTAFDQFIGTPAYMSPEQAMLTSLDIDTRSDIYALGVLLYELLTGKTPFDAKELLAIGLDEMRRTIREQEPPRPSTRLSTLPGQELSTAAQRRSLDAPKLVSELRGDLDWIVMKALEKDRARRYETANGLAMDIQRHLENEPVVACPPSKLYRLQKVVRRNKLAFAAGSAVAASLVVGLTLSMVLLFREQAARQRANHQETRATEQAGIATAVNDFLQKDLLGQASSYAQSEAYFTADPNLTVREALERAAERIGDRFKDQPLQDAAVRHAIGNALGAVGEAERGIAHLQRAFEIHRAKRGADHPNTLIMMRNLAIAYSDAGKHDQALPLLEETLKLQKSRLGPDHPDTLNSMNSLAGVYCDVGKRDQGLLLFEEALKLRKAKLGPDHRETLGSMCNLAAAYRGAGKLDQAIPLFEETLILMKVRLGTDHPYTQNALEGLASAYGSVGKLDQALPLCEEALIFRKASLGPDHPATLKSMNNLAGVYLKASKPDQALPLYEETLKLSKAKLGPDHPGTLRTMDNLANVYRDTGKLDEALPLYEETLKLRKAKLGSNDRGTLDTMHNLAVAYCRTGKLDQGLPLLEEVLNLRKASHGPDHPNTAKDLAWAYETAGKFDQALPLREELFNLRKAKLGPDHSDTLDAMSFLVSTCLKARKFDQALQLVRESLPGVRSRYTNDPLRLALWLLDAAELHYRLGCYAEAAPLYREVIQCRRARLSTDHKDVLGATASLARLLSDWAWAERDSKSEVRNAKSEMAEHAREAERLLREVLALRLRDSTNSWRLGDTKSRLGGALVSVAVTDSNMDAESRRAKLSEAESLLLDGHERLQNPSAEEKHKRDELQRIVRLYEALNNSDKRSEWQQKLERYDKAQEISSASESLTEDSLETRAEAK